MRVRVRVRVRVVVGLGSGEGEGWRCLGGRSAGMPEARRTRSEMSTMKKSSTFQGSRRKDVLPLKARPCATTLNMSSKVKRMVKYRLSFSSHQHTSTSKGLPLAAAAVRRGESMARQMEETTMSKMMSVSHTLLREMVRVRGRVRVRVRIRVRV